MAARDVAIENQTEVVEMSMNFVLAPSKCSSRWDESSTDSHSVSSDNYSTEDDDFSASSFDFDYEDDYNPQNRVNMHSANKAFVRGVVSHGDLLSLARQANTQRKLARHGSDSAFGSASQQNGTLQIVQRNSAIHSNNATAAPPPLDVLNDILKAQGRKVEPRNASELSNFWAVWNTNGYTAELTKAVRLNDVASIHQMRVEHGHNLQCTNKFGESIVHTAARRGATEVLKYLVIEAGVSMLVCCDNGRNPLHDACWTGQPNFDCIRFLLQECPDFLFLKDNRGLLPLEYVPKDTWNMWAAFLQENPALLLPKFI